MTLVTAEQGGAPVTAVSLDSKEPIAQRIKASLLLGALGDSLGAPVEILKLTRILELTKGRGITQLMAYDPGEYLKYAPCEQTGIGAITDDTCMTAAVAAGLLAAKQRDSLDEPAYLLHQAFLTWGRHQAWAEGDYRGRLDVDCEWPDWFHGFCFSSGAGKNTLAALNSGEIGTLERPFVLPSSDPAQPPFASEGCGGMMRVAPVGWFKALGLIKDAYHTGCVSAAITHGGIMAQRASGALAYLIAELAEGHEWSVAIVRVLRALKADPLGDPTARLAEQALEAGYARGSVISFQDLDELPESLGAITGRGSKFERFLTGCVWVQALTIMAAVQRWPGDKEELARRALTLAVTHSGDSDTLGAIVGNLIGAQLGAEAIPLKMVRQLQNIRELEALSCELSDLALGLPHRGTSIT